MRCETHTGAVPHRLRGSLFSVATPFISRSVTGAPEASRLRRPPAPYPSVRGISILAKLRPADDCRISRGYVVVCRCTSLVLAPLQSPLHFPFQPLGLSVPRLPQSPRCHHALLQHIILPSPLQPIKRNAIQQQTANRASTLCSIFQSSTRILRQSRARTKGRSSALHFGFSSRFIKPP